MHVCNDWVGGNQGAKVLPEVIVNSIKVCSISVETDSSEDSLIHCIKPGGVAADATAEISAETAVLLQDVNEDDLDTDPFASDEEFEDNETVVDDE